MTSTEDAKELLIDGMEDSSIDYGHATRRQALSARSPLNKPSGDNNPNHSHSTTTIYGSVETIGVTRNQTSAPAAYRPGANPDGAHAIQITDDGPNTMEQNDYQYKKNLAQGMMDLALLSANANQLRYVLESCQNHPFFYVNVVLISISIFIQIMVGFGMIWNSQYSMNHPNHFLDRFVSIGILVITIVNVIISAFNIAEINKS